LKKTSVEVNYGAYDNPTFDAAVTAAEIIVDRAKRMVAFKDAEAIALADQAMIPLLLPVHRLLVQTYVNGVTPNPGGGYPSRYISVQRPGAARRELRIGPTDRAHAGRRSARRRIEQGACGRRL
jgi:ABC-type oligopeptide transport system substrate-binding subunit